MTGEGKSWKVGLNDNNKNLSRFHLTAPLSIKAWIFSAGRSHPLHCHYQHHYYSKASLQRNSLSGFFGWYYHHHHCHQKQHLVYMPTAPTYCAIERPAECEAAAVDKQIACQPAVVVVINIYLLGVDNYMSFMTNQNGIHFHIIAKRCRCRRRWSLNSNSVETHWSQPLPLYLARGKATERIEEVAESELLQWAMGNGHTFKLALRQWTSRAQTSLWSLLANLSG